MTIQQLYKQWLKETKRGGGVLIGGSIMEWSNYLIANLDKLKI